MMPRNPENERVTATFRCSPALLDRLAREADQRVLGRSRLIVLLLERGLAALESPDTPTPTGFKDREPQPEDGPDYHAEHQAWVERQS